MSNESLIHAKVMKDKQTLLISISRNVELESFVLGESKRIQQENPLLTELLSLTYDTGAEILGNFKNVHYLLGATLAHMLIRESRRYQETSTPSITMDTMHYYSAQMLTIAGEAGVGGFISWLKTEAHTLVPDLATFFEQTIKSDLPPEMYWGMVDVAYPFAIEAKIIT